MTVAVVADSACSLAPDIAARNRIGIVPIQVVVGAETFVDGPDVTADRIAQALRNYIPVNTSRPSPQAFADAYDAAIAAGAEEIVSLHVSADVSGTFDSAQLAAKAASVPVHVIDTRQVALAAGFIALNAARAARNGAAATEVIDIAQATIAETTTYFYVDTLEFLRRGGRVGAAAALIGSALAVKPLLTVDEGVIKPLEKVRTATRALARLHDMVVERAADHEFQIGVQHLDAKSHAEAFAERLATSLGGADIEVSEVGAAIAAHVGPGVISVALAPQIVH